MIHKPIFLISLAVLASNCGKHKDKSSPTPNPGPTVSSSENTPEKNEKEAEVTATETPAPAVVETPAPAVVETPAPAVVETPAPAVVESPAPVVETPAPVGSTGGISAAAFAQLKNAADAWKSHGIEVSVLTNLNEVDQINGLRAVEIAAQNETLRAKLNALSVNMIVVAQSFQVSAAAFGEESTFLWAGNGGEAEALQHLKNVSIADFDFKRAFNKASDAWEKLGINLMYQEGLSGSVGIAAAEAALKAADDQDLLAEIKRLEVAEIYLSDYSYYSKFESIVGLSWDRKQSLPQLISYLKSLTTADQQDFNIEAPKPEDHDKNFAADRAKIHAYLNQELPRYKLTLQSKEGIPNRAAIKAMGQIKLIIDGAKEIRAELSRLKVNVIELSLNQAYIHIPGPTAEEHRNIVSWKFTHNADQFLNYLRSLEPVQ